ncbi:hypothetical protein HWV62_24842 [Athelia sp. TMB]|nr:hypothetical protein HWV62_24842 [Athelia sp. TMB]
MDPQLQAPLVNGTFDRKTYAAGLLQSITSIYSHGERYCYANSGKPGDGSFHECIHVKPMGPITLPLDALAITRLKSAGKQLEPQVWEFKGTNVSFSKHRQWGKFREGFLRNALQDLYPYENKPTFQLQRLLLCGPGSCHNPYSNLRPKPASFANLQVFLPCQHTGGTIKVQFTDQITEVDTASIPEDQVTLLTWFSEALYNVTPVLSGYRLVLVYDVLHTGSGPAPLFSQLLAKSTELRASLRQWATAIPMQRPPHTLAFCLHSLYRGDQTGVMTRADALRLQPEAEAVGLCLFIATLNCRLTGAADVRYSAALASLGPLRWSKPYHEDHPIPRITQVLDSNLGLDGFVDLEGCPHPHMAGWPITDEEVTVGAPLETCLPDYIEYDGSLDERPGLLHQQSQVSVLCIITAHAYSEFLLRVLPHKECPLGGFLQPSDEKTARYIVARQPWNRLVHCIPWLAYVALKVNDFAFWRSILEGAITSVGVGSQLPDAVHFSLACINHTFESVITHIEYSMRNEGLSRLAVLAQLYVHNPFAVNWYPRYTCDILRSTLRFGEEEVHVLIEVAIQSIPYFNNILLPALHHVKPGYEFCVELFAGLDARRSEISPHDPSITIVIHGQEMTTRSSVEETLEKSLQLALDQWFSNLQPDLQPDEISRSRAIQLLELCITTGRVDTCGDALLRRVLDIASAPNLDARELFVQFFVPFQRELRELLKQFDLLKSPSQSSGSSDSSDPTATAFLKFYRELIKCYVLRMMGAKPSNMGNLLEGLGCGCTTCEKLDQFLSSERRELHISGDALSLNHVHARAQMSSGHVTATLIPGLNKQTLIVIKQYSHNDLIVHEDWRRSKAEAVKFLSLIGDRTSIKLIMGHDYVRYLGTLDELDIATPSYLDLTTHNDWF